LSTEGFRAVRACAVLAFGVALLARPAGAAEVDFRPILTFGLFHNGNIQIIGDNAIGDDSAAVAVDLAVDRITATGTFRFLYQATYVGYRQNSGLNYMGNLIAASYVKELSRRSRMQATGGVSRTDTQGVAAGSINSEGLANPNADRSLTFLPRTTITEGYGTVSGSVGAGRRGFVDWLVSARVNRYDDVPGVVFNNSTSAGALGGWRYELSERSTLGFAVGVEWFGYEVTDDTLSTTVALTGTHELGRETTMTYAAGATRTTTAGDSSTSGRFLLSFARALTETSNLNAGVRQSVTPGTGLQAATNDTGGWVSYTPWNPRNGLYGALDGAYWLRKTLPTDTAPTTSTETLNVAGALGWRFTRYLSLSAAYAYYFQKDRSDATSTLNTRYASYGLFLRWAIRGFVGAPDVGGRGPRGI
jgi:hypothetical protein